MPGRITNALAVPTMLILGAAASALAQLPPAPTPTVVAAGACTAVAGFQYDVSSIAGADRALWEIRRGQAGQAFGAATEVASDVALGATGSVVQDLRDFGPVLDGTRYFFRLKARQGSNSVSNFSEPVLFEPSVAADGMFTAVPVPTPVGVRVDWSLTGAIGPCADQVAIRVARVNGASIEQAGTGTAGTSTVDLAASGAGDYDVRLQARFNGALPANAVGRESAPVRVAVQALAAREESGTAVPITIASFRLQGGAASVQTATPITLDVSFSGATPTQYKAAVCGAEFTAAAFQSLPTTPIPGFPTAGTRAVCFQARNAFLTSAVASDSILVFSPLAVRLEPPTGPPTGVTGLSPAVPPEITRFRIHNGRPFVAVGTVVPLDIVVSGSPTEFRRFVRNPSILSGCQPTIDTVPFAPFAASPEPTQSFSTPGQRFVCIQFRRGSQVSAVVEDDIRVVRDVLTLDVVGPATSTTGFDSQCGTGSLPLAPDDNFAVGIKVRRFNTDTAIVHAVGLRCSQIGPNGEHGTVATAFVPSGLVGMSEFALDCPSGQVLAGFRSRHGFRIDKLGIHCIPWRDVIGANGDAVLTASIGGAGGDQSEDVICPIPLAVRHIELSSGSVTDPVTGIRPGCYPPEDM